MQGEEWQHCRLCVERSRRRDSARKCGRSWISLRKSTNPTCSARHAEPKYQLAKQSLLFFTTQLPQTCLFYFIRCDRLYFLYVSDKLLMWWTDGWSSLLQRFSHAAAGRTCVLLVCLLRHLDIHICVSLVWCCWLRDIKSLCDDTNMDAIFIFSFLCQLFSRRLIWQIWPTLFTLFFVFCFFQRPVNSLLTVTLPLLYVACCGIYCSWSVLELVIVPTA